MEYALFFMEVTMKKSKLRGYIYDLEHKNKNFSFDKTIRILDISNMIYIDMINNI